MAGFRQFLIKTNALALAIGVIIGVALGTVVTSLVNDIIMPPIGLALGRVDFNTLKWVLQAGNGTNPAAPGYVAEVAIRYGTFINAVISFVIIALVVYWISIVFMKPAPEPPAAPTKTCPFCKETVPADATKCRACASSI